MSNLGAGKVFLFSVQCPGWSWGSPGQLSSRYLWQCGRNIKLTTRHHLVPRSGKRRVAPPLPHTSQHRPYVKGQWIQRTVESCRHQCAWHSSLTVHKSLQGGKLFLLYVAPVVMDRNIFIWKCHLLIITDVKLRRAQNVHHKSQSVYRRMSPLTIGYAYCILYVLLYPLSNYTPCSWFPYCGMLCSRLGMTHRTEIYAW